MSERLFEGWEATLREPGAFRGNRAAMSLAPRLRELRATLLGGLQSQWLALVAAPVERVASARPKMQEWSLIDEDQAELDIEISRLVQRVELDAEWELRELKGIVAELQPEGPGYPWLPLSLARALSAALRDLKLEPGHRALLMRLSVPLFAAELKALYARTCEQLRRAGAPEPVYRASVSAPTPVAAAAAMVMNAVARTPAAPRMSGAARVERPASGLARLHERARQPAAPPTSLSDLGLRLSEQMLRDPRLDDATRRALQRLRPRIAELAAVDAELLSREDHPVWTLIEQIADHAAELPPARGPQTETFVAFLEALLDRLDRLERGAKRADFETAVGELKTFVATDHQRLIEQAAPQVRAMSEAEREQELLPILRQQLELQLGRGYALPPSLQQFLLGPWVSVLCHAVVHLGESDTETQALMGVVDELQLSLRRPRDEAERRERVQTLPHLLDRLRRGMALIDLDPADRQRLLDSLMKAHRRLLFRPMPAPPPPPETGPETGPNTDLLAEALLDEMPADRWTGGSESAASDTHLGGLPTVPMGAEDDDVQLKATRWLARLPIGVRCKIFLHGQWTTAHLIWRSDNGQFYMFSSALGTGSHSMTRRAIERLRVEGLVTDVAEPGLLQRAVAGLLKEDGLA